MQVEPLDVAACQCRRLLRHATRGYPSLPTAAQRCVLPVTMPWVLP